MEKVLLTTYRKLYKMSSRVDGSTGMRSILSCAPSQVYNHRRGEWAPINVAKLASWVESRIFLDNLIRRLNGGRQFYIPPTTEADRAYAEQQMADLRKQEEAARQPDAASSTAAAAPSPASGTGTAKEAAAAAASTQHGAFASQTPLSVVPFCPLRNALRTLFEVTPFSMGNLNNGFAAVKELSYVCEVTDKHRPFAIRLPGELKSRPRPKLERVLTVDPIHHVRLIKGLTEEVMENLRMSRRRLDRKAAKASTAPPVAGAAAAAAAAAPANAFDDAAGKPTLTEEDEREATFDEAEEEGAAEGDECEAEGDFDVAAATSAVLGGSTREACNAAPAHVQLLLSHPQLGGFFRHSVLLMVRNAENEAAAFIINKPLENDEGLRMPVNATIRLNHVHPIFGKHLRNHIVMVGGPVMVGGAFDESVFLLHSVPDVPSALPLGNGLWLDGNLDKLMEKIQSGAAKAEQVVVICGFSGWGVKQLKGEVESGTWVVVSGDAADKAVTDFVMQLADVSGAHAAPMDDVVGHPTATPASTAAAVGGDTPGSTTETEEEQEDTADLSRLSVRVSVNRRATASWVWAYDVMGEPLASLATNQRPETGPDFSE